jgi:magnesium chelatase subunit I
VLGQLRRVPGLLDHVGSVGVGDGDPTALVAAAGEFILEGLYAQRKIGRSEDRGFVAPERREPDLDLERLERLRRMKKQVN